MSKIQEASNPMRQQERPELLSRIRRGSGESMRGTGKGVNPTDYIPEYMGDRIELDFTDLAAQLPEEVG